MSKTCVRVELAVTDVTGKTGMQIIRAILAGERDPMVLAGMRDERCAKSQAAIADALFGKYCDEQLFILDHAATIAVGRSEPRKRPTLWSI